MPPSQPIAHDVSSGSGVTTGQPDLRDPLYAQNDPTPPAPLDPEPSRVQEFKFTEEQIEKARREEREKVQREKQRLKELADAQKAELDELKAFRQAKEAEEEARRREAEKKARKENEKELSAKQILDLREQEWERRQQEMEQRFAQLEAKASLERQVMELAVYIQRRIAEERAQETIADEFVDYIDGTNVDEVEASIERAKLKTANILEKVAASRGGTPSRGVSISSGPAALPSDLGGVRETTDEVDYTNMSVAEYIKNVRPKLNIGAGGKGLFD